MGKQTHVYVKDETALLLEKHGFSPSQMIEEGVRLRIANIPKTDKVIPCDVCNLDIIISNHQYYICDRPNGKLMDKGTLNICYDCEISNKSGCRPTEYGHVHRCQNFYELLGSNKKRRIPSGDYDIQ